MTISTQFVAGESLFHYILSFSEGSLFKPDVKLLPAIFIHSIQQIKTSHTVYEAQGSSKNIKPKSYLHWFYGLPRGQPMNKLIRCRWTTYGKYYAKNEQQTTGGCLFSCIVRDLKDKTGLVIQRVRKKCLLVFYCYLIH